MIIKNISNVFKKFILVTYYKKMVYPLGRTMSPRWDDEGLLKHALHNFLKNKVYSHSGMKIESDNKDNNGHPSKYYKLVGKDLTKFIKHNKKTNEELEKMFDFN